MTEPLGMILVELSEEGGGDLSLRPSRGAVRERVARVPRSDRETDRWSSVLRRSQSGRPRYSGLSPGEPSRTFNALIARSVSIVGILRHAVTRYQRIAPAQAAPPRTLWDG